MSTRFVWLLGAVVLIAFGALVACGTHYSSSSDGLLIVASQGTPEIATFSFSLANGHIAGISNPPTPPGLPTAIVLDPSGSYAYTIVSSAGIQAYKVNSGGTVTSVGSVVPDPSPVALAMDSAGKFLFVAEGLGGTVSSYSISAGVLTAVPATFTFNLPTGFQTPNFAALGATPTVFPANGLNEQQNAVCSDVGNNPPTSEYLYAADSINNVIYEFAVDTSTGALGNPPNQTQVAFIPAGTTPLGVAVDPCARFVYAANSKSNNISAYTICDGLTTQSSQLCPASPDGTLVPVPGSPFSLSAGANGPGPIMVEPFGNFLYVVDVKSNMVSPFKIAAASGAITSQAVVATGIQPTSMAIRGDDNWLFVANFNGNTVSQYAITPATGVLNPQPAITTDNFPWGVAVK